MNSGCPRAFKAGQSENLFTNWSLSRVRFEVSWRQLWWMLSSRIWRRVAHCDTFLRNVGSYKSHAASHPRRRHSLSLSRFIYSLPHIIQDRKVFQLFSFMECVWCTGETFCSRVPGLFSYVLLSRRRIHMYRRGFLVISLGSCRKYRDCTSILAQIASFLIILKSLEPISSYRRYHFNTQRFPSVTLPAEATIYLQRCFGWSVWLLTCKRSSWNQWSSCSWAPGWTCGL
jgi:hypothetical protein